MKNGKSHKKRRSTTCLVKCAASIVAVDRVAPWTFVALYSGLVAAWHPVCAPAIQRFRVFAMSGVAVTQACVITPRFPGLQKLAEIQNRTVCSTADCVFRGVRCTSLRGLGTILTASASPACCASVPAQSAATAHALCPGSIRPSNETHCTHLLLRCLLLRRSRPCRHRWRRHRPRRFRASLLANQGAGYHVQSRGRRCCRQNGSRSGRHGSRCRRYG